MSDSALGRFNRWVEKFYNVKGGPTVVDVNHQVMQTLAIDKGVDHRYLEGWNRFAVVQVIAAVAAQASRFRIRNPAGSNVITIIEQLNCFVTTGATDDPFVTWGAVTTDLANLTTLTFTRMDPRGNPQPTNIVSFNQQAAGGQALLNRIMPVGSNIDFINYPDQQIPNLPGQAVDVQSQVLNQQLVVGIMWRERALESSELT